VQWTYSCKVIDAEAKHKISCDPVPSPNPSLYFKAYQVSLSDPSVPVASQDSCSLYAIDGDKCGQSDLDCKYTKYAKLAEKSLKDGTCASQGYTVKGAQTKKSYPVIGEITITDYTKPSIIFMGSQDTCSLYAIDGDKCGQSDLDCKYTKYAKLAEKSLKDGTCASQGYTVKGSTTTKNYPVIGSITITTYTKPSLSFAAWANSTSSTCNCFNTCLSKTWAECCRCNDCANDPDVKPHCGGQDVIV
jgi:hypothetical protein